MSDLLKVIQKMEKKVILSRIQIEDFENVLRNQGLNQSIVLKERITNLLKKNTKGIIPGASYSTISNRKKRYKECTEFGDNAVYNRNLLEEIGTAICLSIATECKIRLSKASNHSRINKNYEFIGKNGKKLPLEITLIDKGEYSSFSFEEFNFIIFYKIEDETVFAILNKGNTQWQIYDQNGFLIENEVSHEVIDNRLFKFNNKSISEIKSCKFIEIEKFGKSLRSIELAAAIGIFKYILKNNK